MYVRYKYHNEQKIGKVDFIIYNEFADENFIGLTNNEGIFEGKILKASFNIINLIKVGDYVNGNKVTKLGFDKLLLHCKTIECHQEDLSRGYEGVTFVYTNNDIKDVVTKEQFDSMKYVVERDK